MHKKLETLVTGLVTLLMSAGGCAVEDEARGCERLADFSCGCFPQCRVEDEAAIDSGNSAMCNTRLRGQFKTWKVCAKQRMCEEECRFGWGECAFPLYEEVGLNPSDECPAR